MSAKHATVKLGEYVVPLIGIPESSTQQECHRCKKSFNLTEITLDEKGRPHCKKCLNPIPL